MWPQLRDIEATINAKIAGSKLGGFILAAPGATPIAAIQTWKVSYLINMGNSGWSDQWYFAQTVTATTQRLEQAFAYFWTDYLSYGVCSTGSIAGIRYSAVGVPNLGDLIPGGQLAVVKGQAVGTTDYPSVAFYAQLKDNSFQYRRMFYARGIPTSWQTYTPATAVSPVQVPALVKFYQQIQLALTNGDPQLTAVGQFCLLGFAKESPPRTITIPTNVGLAADGLHYQFGLAFGTATYGDTLRVSRVKGAGTQGINGFGKVIGVIPAAGSVPQLYVFSRKTQCGGSVVLSNPGFVITSQYRPYAIATVKPIRIGTKKVGRPFFPTHGRRFVKTC